MPFITRRSPRLSRFQYPQRALPPLVLGDVAAPDQLGPIAFCLQSLAQVLDVGDEVLLVRLYPYLISIVRSYLLRNEINTRYGCLANPYPTGTFTLQDTPALARRDNDKRNRTSTAHCYDS